MDETLDSSKSLSFLADKYSAEKAKGASANAKAMQMIEAISSAYQFCITHMAMSADSKYGVFVLEEHTDYSVDKGRHAASVSLLMSLLIRKSWQHQLRRLSDAIDRGVMKHPPPPRLLQTPPLCHWALFFAREVEERTWRISLIPAHT